MVRSATALFVFGVIACSVRAADDGWTELLKSGHDSP